MDEWEAMIVIYSVAIVCLSVLALGYWYIMRQDGTVLTSVSAVIGGIAGYTYKLLKDRLSKK